MSPSQEPSDAVIAVTHRCNAQCVMCNVWKSDAADRLRPQHMQNLPTSLRTVNLSGGEPFLRDDLGEFVRVIRRRCPGARITISTNAFLVDRIVAMMEDIRSADPGVRLAISLDGVGEAHDRIRGGSGYFENAVRLVETLHADDFHAMRLSMTLSRENLDQFEAVAELADRLGLELGVVAAHAAKTHLGVTEQPAGDMPAWLGGAFARVLSRWLRSWRPRRWLRAHFAAGTYRKLLGRPWRLRCRAGEDFFFLQADGTVYSCSVQGKAMGNLIEQPWDHIWEGMDGRSARRHAHRCPERCWMICTVRGGYRANPSAVVAWIARAKLLAHLRLFRLPEPATTSNTDAHPARR